MDLRLRVQALCASIVTSCEALVALFLEDIGFLYRHVPWADRSERCDVSTWADRSGQGQGLDKLLRGVSGVRVVRGDKMV